ncbi:bifunctional phosphopantothenoylcysteine decarboxylase/phosphopantothenate--cysteine ligase CoaBC [Aeromicrobium sp. 636]|uniref:Coenzyme A biosynthesis bifunctional protein CoaBC n=1 Tax=Aeromicrobium senzhongii TaxID=2663859 RepID=A0A8I0ETQ2_9ACTN|nr:MULTISPECIES: bifunctional phosphopantothenoylcysteine decarboxylase/phosphopantothenate--cysteine ligase CoaBC [Aeromicrobium]MBC9225221.1 bifunctional phosphopantothenoylcysteine decarboxylase/phosphopantothenate--cysteine ligase CoaBC [Aeromicrobium senzhongii]MCQ3997331.1 bifunctional phosphopantothenoylcysteine decarboxylase/phosphopantothenate--cysteine ligase CoaBC [Aeromicrobium sp. 636]MTB87268.1 bifunctional phosphopantothenoylcysteine decarboxylase/phosphopantothenate--cysteine lig
MSRIVLGVTGGVAVYKAALLLRLFTEAGHDVRVVPTDAALEFVGAPTWEALSGHPVQTGVFENVPEVPHVKLGQTADLVVVVPATANTLARAAHGLADDLLTNTLLTARCPVVMAPAMHTEMWQHPATVANVETLRERGVLVIDPDSGRLTGTDTGPGRLPDPEAIFAFCLQVLHGRPRDLAGRHVVVSAGGTREFLDPVRFLGNRSSGRQGIALAEAALARGASVTLVAANVSLDVPAGAEVVRVVTTAELREAMLKASASADAVVMAAAPADFRPVSMADAKIKKQADGVAPTIELTENPDILVELVRTRTGRSPVIAGFAAETGDANGTVLDHARAKLARKGCDLLVVNDVGSERVFGRPDNEVTILSDDGSEQPVPRAAKGEIAHAIWDAVVQRVE